MIYCKFTVESAYERILISVNIWQSYRKESCLTHCVRLGTFVLKDETRPIYLEYGKKQMLLTLVTSILF